MTLRSNHKWYLFAICLLYAFVAHAQYGEQDLRKEADQLFEQEAFVQAMPLYAQLLSLNPSHPTYNFKYGASALYGDADKKEESIKYLRFASQKSGVAPEVWFYLGRAYHLNYLFDDAIAAYQRYGELVSSRVAEEHRLQQHIEACRSGLGLLSHIKDITVLSKKSATTDDFFRLYDLTDIGGKILVTPNALLSNLDKKRNHRSLIHYRGAGTTVYFSSYGRDGKNGLDIYRAEVLPGGEFSNPVALPPTINSPFDEDFPYMHPDGKSLYFSSKGHGSMGGYDVFRSHSEPGTAAFTAPQNLDFAINTPDDDLFYVADSLNRLANFASSRSSAQGGLHVYRVEVEAAPMAITFVKGDFANRISPDVKTAKITVTDAATNEELTVQYSDPATGDYVLSFPRGGRYKFLVEVKNSDRIHAGIVDIPKSTGLNAYVQEMELISVAGTEKLLINNRFEQTFEGDITALAQKMLRQKAQLDVNFDQKTESPAPQPEIASTPTGPDMRDAYHEAGFGAGLSNEAVVEQAEMQVSKLDAQLERLDEFIRRAAHSSDRRAVEAQVQLARAEELAEMAKNGENDDPYELMFRAGVAKYRANLAMAEARNSRVLYETLVAKREEMQAERAAKQSQNQELRDAIASGDYERAVSALKEEKNHREAEDKVEERFDPVRDIREQSIASRNAARKALDRATALRSATDERESALRIAERRREQRSASGDTPELDAEIERLSQEVESARRRTAKAFEQAESLQREADDEDQRYTLLARIESATDAGEPFEGEMEIQPMDDKTQSELRAALDSVEVDPSMVATYLQANPGAANDEFGGLVALEFRKHFAASASDISTPRSEGDVAAINPADTASTALSENAAADTRTDGETPTEVEQDGAARQETASDSEKQNGSGDVAEDTNETPDEIPAFESTSIDSVSVAAEAEFADTTRTAMALDSPSNEENQPPNRQVETVADTGNYTGRDQALASSETPTSNPGFQNDYDPSLSLDKRIKAERVKVTAARDWVKIIEESIEELQSGVGGGENSNTREQLAQYRTLRQEKLEEIEAREANIASWQAQSRDADAEVLHTAFADVDTLDASLVSRLEMKIPELAEDVDAMRDLRTVDRDYLSELAAIELSGVSAPEIAERRIDLNREFIADLNELIEGRSATDIPTDRLLELRRIMALGIARDREVRQGTLAYTPRTPEAREYASLVTGEEVDEVAESTADESPNTSKNLSPELAADLELQYTRSRTLPGYDERLTLIRQESDSTMFHALRLELNRDYLQALSSEIELYKAALESTQAIYPPLQERYDLLLAERSAAVDQVDRDIADLARLETEFDRDDMVADTDTEEAASEPTTDRELKSEIAATGTEDLPESANSVEDFRMQYERAREELNTADLSERERLDSLAVINANMAAEINRVVEGWIAVLDDPGVRVDRDSLQTLITDLDAMAVERRAEADRFRNELTALPTNTDRDVADAQLDADPTTPVETRVETEDNEPLVADSMSTIDREVGIDFDGVDEVSMTDMDTVSEGLIVESPDTIGAGDLATTESVDTIGRGQPDPALPEASDAEPIANPEIKGVDYFQGRYAQSHERLENTDLSDRALYDSLAALNAEIAREIESEIVRLTASVNNDGMGSTRDSLQTLISSLEAVAADKRQEADRYRTASEELVVEVPASEVTGSEGSEGTEWTEDGLEPHTDRSIAYDTEIEVAEGIVVHAIPYRSLNANIRRDALEDRLDTAHALARRIASMEEKLDDAPDGEREELKAAIVVEKSRLVAVNESLLEGVEVANAAELAHYAAENRRLLEEIAESELPIRDSIGNDHRGVAEVMAELERLTAAETDEVSDIELSEAERSAAVKRDIQRVELLAEMNEDLREASMEIRSMEQVAATGVEENRVEGEIVEPAEDKGAMAVASDPDSYKPEAGRTYLAPIHRRFTEDISVARRQELISSEPALDVDLSFADTDNPEAVASLVMSQTEVDQRGIDLLRETPEQLTYLTTAIRADSLKVLELRAAERSSTWSAMARERMQESTRLEQMASREKNGRESRQMTERAARLDAEAQTLFQKSAIAAAQAEVLRMERRQNEERLAESAVELSAEQRTALDDLLMGPVYAVVPSDLVSEQPADDRESTGVDKAEPTELTEPERIEPTTAADADVDVDADLPYEPVRPAAAATSYVPEDLLAETEGNWLNVVNIIAEKDDFSDVDESMFVAADREDVYSERNPIPLDPAMPEGLVFQVQVGAYRNRIPQDLFGEFAPVMGQRLDNGITRYRAGLFTLYGQAAEARDRIRAKGYSDAFVVAYLNGERLTGGEARDILAQARTEEKYVPPATAPETMAVETDTDRDKSVVVPDYYTDPEAAVATQVEATTGLFFTVQVGVYSKPVKLGELYDLDNLNTELTSGGLIRYTTGRYGSIDAARPKKAEARQKGVGDAFITAYYNGVRIPIDSARAVLEIEGREVVSDEVEGGVNASPVYEVDEAKSERRSRKKAREKEGKYIVIMGRFSKDVPRALADLFLQRPELNIRRIEGPAGGAIYITSEFENREQAVEILEISREAGVNTAVMGRMVDGEIREIVTD